MLRTVFKNISVFVGWLVICALALLVLLQGRELYLLIMVNVLGAGKYAIRFWNDVYYILAGIGWLGYFIWVDHSLNQAAGKGRLVAKVLFMLGVTLLVLALIQVGLMAYRHIGRGALQIALTGGEFLVGALMVFISRRLKAKAAPPAPQP